MSGQQLADHKAADVGSFRNRSVVMKSSGVHLDAFITTVGVVLTQAGRLVSRDARIVHRHGGSADHLSFICYDARAREKTAPRSSLHITFHDYRQKPTEKSGFVAITDDGNEEKPAVVGYDM